ncbi:hypothetical protein [Sporosalibacterium faouarense]|uniref:hypothetical protein n=1 Tax=Sporosalibacterium faouarense TaxID=516123 RepID=UPI00141CA15D|nr:hypothetical protein [Sporosalibacterium faouarense]MTI49351.1 hypothetical protein [Bacillota bacterium]
MKKFTFLFLIFIILSSIFIGKNYYNATKLKTTFSSAFDLNSNITIQLIKNYFSEDRELHKKAEDIIKVLVLEDLDYEDWLEYTDYIEMTIYPMEITRDLQEELVIVMNLSKDEGIIGIYKLKDDKYVYENKIKDLAFIENVEPLEDALNNRVFLVIEELLDESFGAYFIDDYIRIFTLIDEDYEEVYRESMEYEAFYYEKWFDPSIENPKWYRLNENNLIDYMSVDNGTIVINTAKSLAKYESQPTEDDSIPEDFQLATDKSFELTSIWNENYQYFLQGVGKIKNSNKIVGIIEDSSQSVESLMNSQDNHYKVIDKNGKINYIDEKDLELLRMF